MTDALRTPCATQPTAIGAPFPDGWGGPFESSPLGIRSDYTDIACASLTPTALGGTGEIHVLAVTGDGKLWHVRGAGSRYGDFVDVSTAAGLSEPVSKVSAAVTSYLYDRDGVPLAWDVLHVCVVTADGRLYHTLRDGSQQEPFRDVESVAGDRGDMVNVALAGFGEHGIWGNLHVCATSADGRLWHTIRYTTQNGWQEIWDATRPESGNWYPFGRRGDRRRRRRARRLH